MNVRVLVSRVGGHRGPGCLEGWILYLDGSGHPRCAVSSWLCSMSPRFLLSSSVDRPASYITFVLEILCFGNQILNLLCQYLIHDLKSCHLIPDLIMFDLTAPDFGYCISASREHLMQPLCEIADFCSSSLKIDFLRISIIYVVRDTYVQIRHLLSLALCDFEIFNHLKLSEISIRSRILDRVRQFDRCKFL